MVRGREGYSGATQGTQKKPWETKAVVSRALVGRREISMSNAAYRYLEMRVGKYAQTGDIFKNSGMIEAC